jgi:DNA-binding NarL/FixJ family response regulator
MIKVAVLDHYQSILDGYRYRLDCVDDIEIVAEMRYGSEVESALAKDDIDVLILAGCVPTEPDNQNLNPIFHLIPTLLQTYSELVVLPICMQKQANFVKAVIVAGASGYISKDDQEAIKNLDEIIRTVAEGGFYISEEIKRRGFGEKTILTPRQLEALSLCAAYPDETTAKLARRLDIANSTMRNLLSKAYRRLGVPNRAAAIVEARRIGLLPNNRPPTLK